MDTLTPHVGLSPRSSLRAQSDADVEEVYALAGEGEGGRERLARDPGGGGRWMIAGRAERVEVVVGGAGCVRRVKVFET